MSKRQKKEIETHEAWGHNHVEVKVSISIGGVLYDSKKTYYRKNIYTSGTDLEQLARIILMYQRMYGLEGGSAYDFLDEIKDKVENRNGLTVDQLMQKYYVNLKQTIEEEFNERNKAGAEYSWWGDMENDYLKYGVANWVENISNMPEPQRLACLYALSKLCGDAEGIKKEIDNCPQWLKELVDGMFGKEIILKQK